MHFYIDFCSELEDAFYLNNDITYFYDYCTYDTAKKQFEKILIDFRYSPIAEMVKPIGILLKWLVGQEYRNTWST